MSIFQKTQSTLGIILLLVLTGCQSTNEQVDYNPQIDFAQFSTFDFIEPGNTTAAKTAKQLEENAGKEHIAQSPKQTNQLNYDRIKQAITDNLAKKSIHYLSNSEQLHIQFYTYQKQKDSGSSVSVGVGGTSWGSSSSTGIGLSSIFDVGSDVIFTEVTIDMYYQQKMIWRGQGGFNADLDVSVAKRKHLIDKAVKDILAQFPPKPEQVN